MYEVSTAYKDYISNNLERNYKVRLTVGTDVIDSNDIFSYSLETNQPSDKFTIGNAISQMLKIEIRNQEKPFYTNQLYLEVGMLVNGVYEYVPIGYFNIDKSEKKDHRTTITAYDNMYKLEGLYVCKLGNTKTIKDILTDITSKTGIKMAADNYKNYTISDEIVGYSYREVIAMMAGLNGGNAYIDRTGKIKFVYLSDKTTKWAINDFYLFDGNSFKEQSYTIDKVTCYKDKDTSWSNGNLGTTPMTIEYENPFMTQAIAKDIYNKLANINYQAFNMETMSYLALDVGDWITYTSQSNTVYSLSVQHYKFSGGIKQTLEAKTDCNKNNFNVSGSLTQKVNRTITDLLAAKKAIIDKANISDLVAEKITFETINGGSATIQDILTQFIGGDNGQFLHLTGKNVVFDEAVIKDLIAAKISVGDLLAGNIDSERFNIVSKNGNLIIKDNTIQIKDSNRVRIQIGKDASGDYTLNAWDKNGKLLFNSNGITADAIKSKIIRDDMVADNANIDGSKVNIESLIECVNNNNTKTLNASKIVMDGTTQTLEANFKKVTTNILYNQAIGTATSHSWNIITTESEGKANMTHALYKVLSKKMKVGSKVKVAFDFEGKNLVCKDNSKKAIYFQGSGDVTGWNAGAWSAYTILKPSDTMPSSINKHYEYTFTVDTNGIKNNSWTLYLRVDRIDGNFSISNLMIQVDEPFVDFWTKSIWDEENSINTLQTKFNVQQGKVEQLIKDTTIEESGTTKKLKDAYNQTKSTVDGTVQTVSKMETQVNSLNLTNLIRAGGGDYLNVDSSIWSKTGFNSNDTFSLDGSQNNKWYRLFNSNSSGSIYVTNINPITSPSDKKISVSFRYYCNDSNGKIDGIKNIRMYVLQEHSNSNNFYNSYSYVDLDKTTAAKLYKQTFTLNAACTRYMLRFDINNNTLASGVTTAFRFSDIMVVNGSIPSSEWSPSFEDLQVDINSIETRTSKVEQKTTDSAFTVQVQKNQNRIFNVRYIRDYCNGSNKSSTSNQWTEIKAFNNYGNNIAKGKTVTSNVTLKNGTYVTDDDISYNKYAETTGNSYVQIDLGDIYNNIDEIKVWHYYGDARIYNGTKTMVSADGKTWITLFDSATSGTYAESSFGHSVKVNGTSFNSSQVTINELGLHVKNGAIDIQNNAGDTVFGADSAGNLDLVGNITTKDLNTKNKAIQMAGTNLYFYDWASSTRADPIGNLFTGHLNGETLAGFIIGHHEGTFCSIDHYDSSSNSYYPYIIFDKEFKRGNISPVEVYENLNMGGYHLHFGRDNYINGYNNNNYITLTTMNNTNWDSTFGICKEDGTYTFRVMPYTSGNDGVYTNKNTYIKGDLYVTGSKHCIQETEHFGNVKFYATEDMTSYLTWRIDGEFICDKKDDDGNYYTIIRIPDMVRECINVDEYEYVVRIMKTSFGDYKIKTMKWYFKVISDKENFAFKIDYIKGRRKGFEGETYYKQAEEYNDFSNVNSNRNFKAKVDKMTK